MLRQLARYGVEQDGAFARMVQCEAAWWVVQQLVARGMLPADDAQALLYEGTEHVVADFLTAVEEQRLVRAKAPQQQHSAPRRALAQALDRAAAVGERRTPGGIVY